MQLIPYYLPILQRQYVYNIHFIMISDYFVKPILCGTQVFFIQEVKI